MNEYETLCCGSVLLGTNVALPLLYGRLLKGIICRRRQAFRNISQATNVYKVYMFITHFLFKDLICVIVSHVQFETMSKLSSQSE